MKRLFFFLLLFFAVSQLAPLYAQTPTKIYVPISSPIPSITTPSAPITSTAPTPPGSATTPVDGLLFPGVTCGVAGDPDPGKAKCCVPKKKDDSLLAKIMNFAQGKFIIGDLVGPYQEKYVAVSELSQKMDPCALPGIPFPSTNDPGCICIEDVSSSTIPQLNNFCTQYFPFTNKNSELQECSRCVGEKGGFYTAIGCIPLNLSTFITSYILTIGVGIAGGIALLCIIYSAFRMQTSMGNPEAIKKAQENLTACITGLIIVIFSVLILKIIGVDILRIPGISN